MNHMQDLTPQERMDEALLARVLGCASCEDQGDVKLSCALGVSRMEQSQPTCGCGDASVRGFGVMNGIGAALYLPLMTFDEVYDPDTAFRRGTMFAALDKPFYGDGKEVDCRGR